MRVYKIATGLLVVSFLTCCTSYKKGTVQEISIHTAGIDAVDCMLETKDHRYNIIAPGIIKVDRSPEEIKITCMKAGYVDKIKYIRSVMMIKDVHENVFNGYLPGTLYDVATNSVYNYPDMVMMDMKLDPNRIRYGQNKEEYVLPKKDVPIRIAPKKQTKEEINDSNIQADTVIRGTLVK